MDRTDEQVHLLESLANGDFRIERSKTMYIWDCTWGSRKAEVQARTQIGAKKAARKAWGRTVRRPEDHEIQAVIRRLPDGTPVKR